MFDLFIALFGGACIAQSKLMRWSNKQEDAKSEAIKEELAAKLIAPYTLEQQIDDLVKNPRNTEKVMEELRDDLQEVLGDNYRSMFTLAPRTKQQIECGAIDYRYWAKQLLLAHKGKVSSLSFYRFKLAGAQDVQISINFCKRIERLLWNGDPRLKLAFAYAFDTSGQPTWNPAGKEMCFVFHLLKEDQSDPRRRLW